jgi:hypothetical protein
VAASNTASLQGASLSSILQFQAGKQVNVQPTKGDAAQQKALRAQVNKEQKNIVTVVPSQALLQWMQFNAQGGGVTVDNNTATNATGPQYTTATPPILSGAG